MINLKEMLSKDYFMNYCSQIKIYFLLALLLLIVGFLVGWAFSGVLKPYMNILIQNLMLKTNISNLFQDIFINNLRVNILIILGGILFSIFSIFSLFINGVMIGYVATIVPFTKFLVYIVPHGIFEIPSFLLATTTAFMITHVIIRCIKGIFSKDLTMKGEFSKSRNLIETIGVSIILVMILVLIAAVIEVYFTKEFATFILSIMA